MKKTQGKLTLRLLALFTILNGGIIMLTDAISEQASAALSATTASASVGVISACTFGASTHDHTADVAPGKYLEQVGDPTVFTVNCNDQDGFVVYAVGVSDGKEGTTAMVGSGTAKGTNIETGTAKEGDKSNWSFKVQDASPDLKIQSTFGGYSAIPASRTAVVKKESGIAEGDKFSVSYALYVSNTQVAGTYTGKVKYILFHPSSHGTVGPTIADLTYMQDFNTLTESEMQTVLDSMVPNQQYELTDSRDLRKYYISKLTDGNVWMTENLDLFLDRDRIYTPDDTDVKQNWSPSESTHITGDTSWNGYDAALGEKSPGLFYPQSYDPGDICWNGDQTWTAADGASHFDTDSKSCESHDKSHWHVGNYYNYAAAVAQNDTSSHTANKEQYDTSICPAGWQLPNLEGNKSYTELQAAADRDGTPWVAGYIGSKTPDQPTNNVSTIHAHPFYFPYTGLWKGYYGRFGSGALYRPSAVSSTPYSYFFGFDGSGNLAMSTGWRLDGFSVRCVARDAKPTMQTVDQWGKDVQLGQTVTALDARDRSVYRVRRLADGKLWMVDNLRLGSSSEITLTADNTDLNGIDEFTLPASTNSFSSNYDTAPPQINSTYADTLVPGTDGKVGVYYSWYAAIAGSVSNTTGGGVEAPSSICPKGWRLPRGGENGDFKTLNDVLGGNLETDGSNALQDPSGPNILLAGNYANNSVLNQFGTGYLWSSMTYDDEYSVYAYDLYLIPTYVNVKSRNGRIGGMPVRCIAR